VSYPFGTPDEILARPIDELALLVLRDAKDRDTWNWHNWLLEVRQQYPRQNDVIRAFSEAWNWLFSHDLVAYNPEKSSEAAVMVSRRGEELLKTGLSWLKAVERLDIDLVPELEQKARPQFLRGDFETAAFVSMKEVEIQVRARAGLSDSILGTKLMQEAFRPGGGALTQPNGDPGEAVALMELFKGAIGMFKNPSSHRQVDFTDPTEAAEVVLLADLLLRLLKKV
jgi:uncharacterized protein (TIGR02391 family)